MAEEKKTLSIEEITTFLNRLSTLEEAELAKLIKNDRDGYARLLESMGGFIDASCGNLNKLYEKIIALDLQTHYENSAENIKVKHIATSYGADIQLINRDTGEVVNIEVKCSSVKKKTKYHTNWNFPANSDLIKKYKKTKDKKDECNLILDYYRKMNRTVVVAYQGTKQLNSYEIDGLFMSLVCAKKAIMSISGAVNFGCARCTHCNTYHRIVHLQKMCDEFMGDALLANPDLAKKPSLACFTTTQWKLIFADVRAHKNCDKYET